MLTVTRGQGPSAPGTHPLGGNRAAPLHPARRGSRSDGRTAPRLVPGARPAPGYVPLDASLASFALAARAVARSHLAVLCSCGSLAIERHTETSGTFEAKGFAVTILSWDLALRLGPDPPIRTRRTRG
jgi:hypothetical protein